MAIDMREKARPTIGSSGRRRQLELQPSSRALDYAKVARELVRALRGRRSCAELSRRAGYRSNVVQRWEAGSAYPATSTFLALRHKLRPRAGSWIERFFHMRPQWTHALDPASPLAVALFLQNLRGNTPILRVAARAGYNRYSVARWLDGSSEPRLPDFLRLVDACSRRLVDLVAALEDPARVPSVRERFAQQELARRAAYELPWSHAVLRALELVDLPRGVAAQERFIAERLQLELPTVREALHVLTATTQVARSRAGYRPREVTTIDTSADPERAQTLKLAWTRTALERLGKRAPGQFGYSLFAVSRADLTRLTALHLQYVRAMQELVASSAESECVGLYCAQLFDLGGG